MSDRETVMRGLACCIESYDKGFCPDECEYRGKYPECEQGLMKEALELLREQEPIKPTISVDTWICSKCGHTLESQELIDDKENPQVLIHELYQYCPNCGRAVKWDEAD